MFTVVVGHSEDIDTQSALEDVVSQCQNKLKGRQPSAGLLFTGMDLDYHILLKGIIENWPDIELIGCTTDGEISSELGFAEDSVCLALFVSDSVEIASGVGKQVSRDMGRACREAVNQAKSKLTHSPSFCIATPEGLASGIEQIANTLSQELGGSVPVFGGAAGDYRRFQKTWQFYGDQVLTDAVPIMLFSGPVEYSAAVDSGWQTIGKIGVVTRAEGNVLYEIDNISALAFYRRFLGAEALPMGDYPFAVLDDQLSIQHLRTTLGAYDITTGSMTFSGRIPEGAKVQLAVANRDATLDGCRRSVEKALDQYPGHLCPQTAVLFSCAGRKILLGTRSIQEYEIIQSKFPEPIPVCGFYAYGEIGPSFDQQKPGSCFHNQTFVTLLIGESR